MKPGTSTRYYVAAAMALMCVLIIAVGASLILSSRALEASNRNWCSILDLATSQPVPKPAAAAAATRKLQVVQYEFYVNMLDLKRRFGC